MGQPRWLPDCVGNFELHPLLTVELTPVADRPYTSFVNKTISVLRHLPVGIVAALLWVSQAVGANPFTGTYSATFSNGSVGACMTFVATNGVGTIAGYNLVGKVGMYVPTFTVGVDGAFSATSLEGTAVAGLITNGTISGTYSNGITVGRFAGSIKNNTPQQAIAGVYTGTYTGGGTLGGITSGIAVGILAADGTYFFYANGTLGEDGGTGTLNSQNQMSGFTSANGMTVAGAVSAATDMWTGNWSKTVTEGIPFNLTGTYSLTRTAYLPLSSIPLIATATSLPAGFSGVLYSQTLQATGGTIPYTWSVSSGSLPDGLTLSAAGLLSGTPTAAGTFGFTITCTGADQLASAKAVSLKITTVATVATPGIAPAGGTFSNAVTVTLGCATAGATIRYTIDGSDPTSRSPLYKKTGLPLTNSVTLRVRAFKAKLITSALALQEFVVIPPPAVAIATTSVPAGVVKAAYRAPLAATGGIGPYKWVLVTGSGKLPAGLTLNATTGVIAGKPTKTGPFNFTVKVTDARKQSDIQTFTLTIGN